MSRPRRGIALVGSLLVVTHAAPVLAQKTFDLVIADRDVNGLPLNPRWWWQISTRNFSRGPTPDDCRQPYEAQCTSQNPASVWLGCNEPAHYNWQVATSQRLDW